MLKVLSWIGGKLIAKKANFNPMILFGAAVMLVVMIPIAIFNPGSSGSTDSYLDAYHEIGCGNENEYILEDIRAFESFIDPTSYGNITKENAKTRLQKTYLDVKQGNLSEDKKCFLKPDNKIQELLKSEYTITDEQLANMMQDVNAVRNGRKYLTMPFEGIQIGSYDPEKGKNGILLKGNENTEVLALSDGTIKDIYTSKTKLPYKDPSCSSDCGSGIAQGLTLVIETQMQKGIKEDGEYDTETLLITYSLISNVILNVGDVVQQGDVIGTTKKNILYIAIANDMDEILDPNHYIFIEQQTTNLQLPFDLPIPITSEMGERDLVAGPYHYGLDMDKGQDTPIKVLADGEVYAINTTCAPYGGKLGSSCPELNPVTGGGNYVQIKFEYEDATYYATYMHMAKVDVQKGDLIYAGDIIGTQGHSGNSSASHLHIEIHKDTATIATKDGLIDPKEFLNFDETQ